MDICEDICVCVSMYIVNIFSLEQNFKQKISKILLQTPIITRSDTRFKK